MTDEQWIDKLKDEARILGEARMLRDEDPFNFQIAQQVIDRFKAHLEAIGRSQDWAARSMGISAGTLNSVLQGTYAADPEKQIRAIDKWMETQLLKAHAPKPAGFVKTGVARQIEAAAKWAIKAACIVLVHGPAGIGKTMTARALRAETPGSIFISIRTSSLTKVAVLELISQAINLAVTKTTTAQMFAAIETRLRDTGRLLIVDEVHKLEGRRKDEALHVLRDLHDATGIPMLWLGMTNIATYIQNGHTNGYEPLDQIFSRIGWWLDLTEVATRADGGPGLATIDDIRKIVAAGKLRITPDGEHYLQMLANEFKAGAFRTVTKLLQLAETFSKQACTDKPIDAAMLRSIQRSRLGAGAAKELENRMELRTKSA